MKAPKQTKEPVQQSAPASAPADDQSYDWGQEQTTGFEATRAEDMGIPFLSLLQKGSPQVDEDHKDYETKKLEGAEAGMVINTVTRQIVYNKDEAKPLVFIPAFHEKLYQEWKPRNSGGGFVQSHRNATVLMRCKRNEKKDDVLPNGNIIITTSYFYGFALIEDEWVRTILPMTSTQLKKARAWLNLMHSQRIGDRMPPMYSHAYSLTTVKESNEEGSWWGWKIDVNRVLNKSDADIIGLARQIANDSAKSILQLPAPAASEEAGGGDPADSYAESEGSRKNNR